MENRAISLVESSRDNSLIACHTSSEYLLRRYKHEKHGYARPAKRRQYTKFETFIMENDNSKPLSFD